MTLQQLLEEAQAALRECTESASLESELLVASALGMRRQELLTAPQVELTPEVVQSIRALVQRRVKGEPVAYLLGRKEFYGREFAVNRSVLVPRPETEHLVEAALSFQPSGWIADVGTGSGAIAITLALEAGRDVRMIAIDRSPNALGVCASNVRMHGVQDLVALVCADLLSAMQNGAVLGGVVANLPYVEAHEHAHLPIDVREYEPYEALVPLQAEHPAGLRRRLIAESTEFLRPGGFVALEVGEGQAEEALNQLRAVGFDACSTVHDLAGIPRIVSGRWKVRSIRAT